MGSIVRVTTRVVPDIDEWNAQQAQRALEWACEWGEFKDKPDHRCGYCGS